MLLVYRSFAVSWRRSARSFRHYVVQIDSLNKANAALRTENQEVKRQIDEVTTERQQLREEKERLTEQVTLASKLSVSNFSVRASTQEQEGDEAYPQYEAAGVCIYH